MRRQHGLQTEWLLRPGGASFMPSPGAAWCSSLWADFFLLSYALLMTVVIAAAYHTGKAISWLNITNVTPVMITHAENLALFLLTRQFYLHRGQGLRLCDHHLLSLHVSLVVTGALL